MGEKLPYLPFYIGDWRKDTALSLCTPATRGIWIDLLCAMHELNRSGQITGTIDQLSRVCRCTAVEMTSAINELSVTGAALVTKRDDKITIINRRMKRENEERRKNSERQKKHRAQGSPESQEVDHPHNPCLEISDVTALSREDNALYSHSISNSENKKEKLKKKKSSVPENFSITDSMREWAKSLPIANLET